MAGQFWENDAVVTRGAPQPVFTAPDPRGDAKEGREQRGESRAETGTAIQIDQNNRDRGNDAFRNMDTLASRFGQEQTVKTYKVALQELDKALGTGDGAQGDLALTYAFAKAMDPDSVVRDAEQGMIIESQPWFQARTEAIRKQFGADGAGTFTPEARKALRAQVIKAVASRRPAYSQLRQDYGKVAQNHGIDPFEVVGTDMGQAYLERFAAYDKANQPDKPVTIAAPIPSGGDGGTVRTPEMRGGLPVGTPIEFGGPAAAPFDRAQYLQEQFGVTPDQEALIVAMMNQNRGNANLTPEALKQWYAANGMRPPADADLAQMVKYAQEGQTFGGFDTSGAEQAYKARLQGILDKQGFDPTSTEAYGDRFRRGVVSGLSDEAAGVGGGLAALFNNQGVADGYQLYRDADRLKAEQEAAAQGWTGTGLEIGGNVVSGLAIPGGTGVAGGARSGAMAGAVAGFGYGEGAEESLTGLALGGTAGAALGAGAGKVGEKLTERAAAKAAQPSSASRYADAKEFGIEPGLADVGDMGSRAVERTLDTQAGAAPFMEAARNKVTQSAANAADNVADQFGRATTGRGVGEAVQRGANNWISETEKQAGKLYEAIPIAPDATADLGNTIGQLNALTSKVTSNDALAAMVTDKRLSAWLSALKGRTSQVPTGLLDADGNAIMREVTQGGQLSWNDLKQLRSLVGEEIGQQMFGEKTLRSDLRALYGALSSDMEATAAKQGAGALRQFKRANDFYRARQARIDGVITDLLGKDGANSPETASALIQRIAKGGKSSSDLKLLAQVRKTLAPDEWGQVSNGLVRLLGQPANSEGRQFAAETFVRNYGDMADGAKNLLFGKGELRGNLDKFSEVLRGIAANDASRNSSRTGMSLGSLTSTGLFASAGAAIGGLPGAMLAIVANHAGSAGAAKLWTSPGFVRWATGYSKMLAGASKGGMKAAAHESQMNALGRLAASNTAIAADAQGLQQQLMRAFQTGPERLAAEPNGETRSGAKSTNTGAAQ